ncbi:MAG: hypothetical protein AAF438_02390 [Pseudomonadota bacterium]
MKRIIVLLACLSCLLGCATVLDQDGAVAIAPYHLRDAGRIVVEVTVNGKGPFEFALDTAASISVVFEDIFSIDSSVETVEKYFWATELRYVNNVTSRCSRFCSL